MANDNTDSSDNNLDNAYKIKLQGNDGSMVIFDVTPDLIETRNVNYSTVEPIHAPGQINVFKNTSSRSFNISNARLVSRTQKEADRNLQRLWLLRSWCMPRFGKSTIDSGQAAARNIVSESGRQASTPEDQARIFGVELLGTPPQVLYLSAYSRGNMGGKTQHLYKIPVVIQQLSIPYPSDVDYIPTPDGVPMPVIMTIDMTLVETHSPNEYENFSLDAYKRGTLENF